MYDKDDIQTLSYDFKTNTMIVELNKRVLYKGYMIDKVRYKMPYHKYIEKVSNYFKN